MDHVGPMASTVRNAALLLQTLAGYDGLDDRQLGAPLPSAVPPYPSSVPTVPSSTLLSGIKIGVLKEGFSSTHLQPEVETLFRSAAAKFRQLGAEVKEVSVPLHKQGWALVYFLLRVGTNLSKQGRSVGRRGVQLNDFMDRMVPWDQAKWDQVGMGRFSCELKLTAVYVGSLVRPQRLARWVRRSMVLFAGNASHFYAVNMSRTRILPSTGAQRTSCVD